MLGFGPLGGIPLGIGPGGSAYAVSLTESATAADVVASVAVLPSAVAESATASDTVNSAATHPTSITESATAADTVTAGAPIHNVTIAESGSAADVVSVVLIAHPAITESASPNDVVNSGVSFAVAITEATTATDTPSSTPIYLVGLTEAATAADTVSAKGTFGTAVAETATATDTPSAGMVAASTISEAATASDVVSGGGGVYGVTVTESATAADIVSGGVTFPETVTESASATDLYATGTAVYTVTIVETVAAADTVTAGSFIINPGPGNLGVSGGTPSVDLVPLPSFDWRATVISEYQTSPTLLQLIESLAGYLDPAADFDAFYHLVWNVKTAVGWGLDVWGRIVGVSRVLHVSVGTEAFGWEEGGTTDYTGFGQAPFFGGGAVTSNFALSDPNYRVLILAKAAANITDGSIPAINQILLSLFPGRGNVYVTDGEDMSMTYTFSFAITAVERAIVAQSGALPKPVGVSVTVVTPP